MTAGNLGNQFEDHLQTAQTSEGMRYPNLSRYGTHPGEPGHEADIALGYHHIAKEAHAATQGPSSEEVMAAAADIVSQGHAAGAAAGSVAGLGGVPRRHGDEEEDEE